MCMEAREVLSLITTFFSHHLSHHPFLIPVAMVTGVRGSGVRHTP